MTEEQKQKRAEYKRRYREANREKIRAEKMRYYEAHKETLNQRRRENYHANRERELAKQNARRAARKAIRADHEARYISEEVGKYGIGVLDLYADTPEEMEALKARIFRVMKK